MNFYDETLRKELKKWHNDMRKPPSYFNKISKSIQSKLQSAIPQKVQNILTLSIEKMTKTIMSGSGLLTDSEAADSMSLSESDYMAEKAYKTYCKMAVAQGVACGAGGIILGAVDFPALLSIKVKFLFDCAKFYGYNVNNESERLYMLYIFQLAFSSDEYRPKVYNTLMNWNSENEDVQTIDWEKFQIEYRDYMDIAKLMQLLPVVGAAVGGVANFKLLEKLKITAMNCYRSRYFRKQNI